MGSLDRIEIAIARIEAASRAHSTSTAIGAAAGASTDTELEQRHVALKAAVAQALTRIDGLIADQA